MCHTLNKELQNKSLLSRSSKSSDRDRQSWGTKNSGLTILLLQKVVCWKIVLHGSLKFLHVFKMRHSLSLVLDYIFKDISIMNTLGR